MKPSIALHQNRAAIRAVVERHRAHNARVFGSVVHGNDQEDSDLDILIEPTRDTTLLDLGAAGRKRPHRGAARAREAQDGDAPSGETIDDDHR